MRMILNSSLWRKSQQSSEFLTLFLLQLLTLAQQCYALVSIIKIQGNFSSSKEDGLSISATSMMRVNAAPSHSMPHHKSPLDTAKLHRKRVSITAASDQKNAALLPLQCHTPHATIVIERCVLKRFLHILAANWRHCKFSQGRWGFHLHCHLYDPEKCSSPPIPCHTPHATIAIERCGLNRFHSHILAAYLRHCKSSWRRWGFHLCHLFCDQRKCSSFN